MDTASTETGDRASRHGPRFFLSWPPAVRTGRPWLGAEQDTVAYALAQGLAQRATATEEPDVARVVAAAFAAAEPLDHLISKDHPLATKAVERALRRYLAQELRRIARSNGSKPQDLCDVTDRTLQQWIKQVDE